ncbi:MAG: polyprenol monophosphomannose synthase [Patescibacteria group bacterium]|nr:polyprenol monophosphomannose synthase [Patescibacteria group bacterium]
MKTLVVIPTYNEKENLENIVEQVLGLGLPELAVLVVDDNSPDGTGAVADRLAALYDGRVFALHRAGKQGLGSAYREGFRWGLDRGYEALCEMDADGQHEPAVLRSLIGAVEAGADLAIGSRRIAGGGTEGWGAHRNLMSQAAMTLTRFALGLKTHDVTAGFRCYRSSAVARLLEQPLVSTGYAFQEEATFYCERLGLRVVEVPITFRARRFGTSKLTPGEVARFFTTIVGLWWRWVFRGK